MPFSYVSPLIMKKKKMWNSYMTKKEALTCWKMPNSHKIKKKLLKYPQPKSRNIKPINGKQGKVRLIRFDRNSKGYRRNEAQHYVGFETMRQLSPLFIDVLPRLLCVWRGKNRAIESDGMVMWNRGYAQFGGYAYGQPFYSGGGLGDGNGGK